MLRIAHEGLTFDDVLLLPGYSEVTAKDVSLVTRLTRNIPLNIPLVSAAMDTVTEARLAIALAQEGGIGIVHKNMTILEQAEEVRRVKKFESGVVKDPITIESTASIADLIDLTRANGISGVPVMEAGNLVGIVTRRDIRFETDTEQSVSAIMTPKKKLVTVKEGAPLEEVQRLLHEHRIEKILVVDDDFGFAINTGVLEGATGVDDDTFVSKSGLHFDAGIGIEIAEDMQATLEHRYLDIESRKKLCKFQCYRAAPQYDDRLRQRLQFKSIVAGHAS